MTVDLYVLGLFLSVVSAWILALWVMFLRKPAQMQSRFVFFLSSAGVVGVLAWVRLMAAGEPSESAVLRVLLVMAVAAAVFFFDFAGHLTGKLKRVMHASVYIIGAAAAVVVGLPVMAPELAARLPEPMTASEGFLPAAAVFYLILSAAALHLLMSTFTTGGRKAGQFLTVLGACALLIPGFTAVLLPAAAGYATAVTTYGIFCLTAGYVIAAYAVIRHGYMDLEAFLKGALVSTGLTAFVFSIYFGTVIFANRLAPSVFEGNEILVHAIGLSLVVLFYGAVREGLENLTQIVLFQKRYDYQKLLKDATAGISKIEDLNHLLGLVVHFITMRMRVQSAAILARQEGEPRYRLEYQRGYRKKFIDYYIKEDHPLIHFLTAERQALDLEKLEDYAENGVIRRRREASTATYDFAAIREAMGDLDAACCVPSFLGRELKNILVLGQKRSGHYYTQEDLNLLMTLAQESAIAIENARLFDEAHTRARELEQINSQLEYAKNLLMNALKETEVANKQLQDTQAQLIHEQKMATLGRLAASVGHEVNNPLTILSMNVSRVLLKLRKNPDLKVNDIVEVFEKMEQNIGRIKAVVNTLTGLLKKSEKGKFEPLSLKLILEETLPLVQFQTYLDNLTGTEVDFDVSASIPLVRGDLERLQEVFLNLFINAYHAMQGRQNRKIEVKAEVCDEDPHMVAIHFRDNGQGMSEETRKKIFNYGYTTKPPGKGSGLGLYMCKYIIELHGGDIKVASRIGEGTTFTLTLPCADAPFKARPAKDAPSDSEAPAGKEGA